MTSRGRLLGVRLFGWSRFGLGQGTSALQTLLVDILVVGSVLVEVLQLGLRVAHQVSPSLPQRQHDVRYEANLQTGVSNEISGSAKFHQ